jgi:hypothetical protein
MYDGINSLAAGIHRQFPNAAMVAGYINGRYAWTQAEWNLFPHAKHVTISITASANAGDVLDVEPGDATPAQAGGWIAKRKSAGLHRPTIYCNRSTIPAVREGTGRYVLGHDYDIWVADWTGSAHQVTAPGPGAAAACAAIQYRSTTGYDVSAVYDTGWPHRSAPAVRPPTKPAGVHAIGVTATSVTLAWNNEPVEATYRIRVTYQGRVVKQVSTTGSTATVSGLTPHHTYTFHVSASNPKGASAETNGPAVQTRK